METPSSARRVTRSQAYASSIGSNNVPVSRKIEDSSEKNPSKTKEKSNGCALMDITNDSPIVGLANGGNQETPLAKQRGSRMKKTPGSGEALLRGQVKNLLQKVEEEAVLSKISLESRPFLQLMNSPMLLVAPTPANTPQIPNLSAGNLVSGTPCTVVQEHLIPQVMNHMFDGKKNEEDDESEKSVITRSLLLDFSEKSDAASDCFSELSYEEEVVQGSGEKTSAITTTEEDDASIWSIQVNASTHDEDYEEEIAEDDEEEDYYVDAEEEEGDDDGGLLLDELCEGLNNISVNERVGPKFEGKHTRFVYNSDDEIVKEEEVGNDDSAAATSSNVLRLKGMPTPKGKHLRFSEEE
ncbi:hypothetical protein RIF29_37295 [Crotalaria pallida]|uniref:Uncharacterized protein n=1 Tax=Crotalaria pallida TaxID=3830 RepID=A0AAN9HUS9_CROPI